MVTVLVEWAILSCMFYVNMSVLPRARYKIIWQRYYEEGENYRYVPEYNFKNLGLALLFPAHFFNRSELMCYKLMMDQSILKFGSYNGILKQTFGFTKLFSRVFSLPLFILTAPFLLLWWVLRGIFVSFIGPTIKMMNPKSESPNITKEQIKQQLADRELAKGLPSVVPVLPPVQGDWQNQEYPMPERVTVNELLN